MSFTPCSGVKYAILAPLWRARRRLTAAPSVQHAACSVQRQRAARSVQRYPDASGCERYQLFVQRVYYAHTASSKSPESFGSCCPPALTSPRSHPPTLPSCVRGGPRGPCLPSRDDALYPLRAGRIPVPDGGSGTLALLSRASRMRREACPTLSRESIAWGLWHARGLTRGLPARSLSPGFVNIAPRACVARRLTKPG